MNRTAEAQFGLITADQLRAMGFPRDAVRWMIKCGELRLLLPRVFVIGGAPYTFHQGLMAACLWGGPRSAGSFGSAARMLGLSGFESSGIEISTTNHKHCTGLHLHNGVPVKVHRVDKYLLGEITTMAALPITSARRTVLDLTGKKHPRSERALDDCVYKKLASVGDVWLLYEEEWTRGRRGIAILRGRLVDRMGEKAPTQSDLEDLYRKIVRDFSLPRPVNQYPIDLPVIGTVHLDFAYPARKLAIECDSYAFHMDRQAFERDRERDMMLMALGWTVLRFTWAKLRYQPAEVAELVRLKLAA